jgi:HD-GYP domain-containing protein (c-di-GMP phosphodiesterase class II)
VLGVKVSIDQIQSQDIGEIRIVVLATVASSALIFLSLLALAIAAQRELDRRKRLADETFTQTMGGIASIVDKRDPYTAGHSMRVARYSKLLAQRMNLRPSDIRRVEIGALLHDIGKVGVPDAVLLKKDRLDDNERAIIALHPQIAGEIFNNVEAMHDILPCIVAHHERIDGRGYPGRLAGESIPLGARIIAVADAYDAMTTDRPYRRALSSEVACEELRRCVDSHFDMGCVAAFLRLVEEGRIVPPPPILDEDLLERAFGQQLPGGNP